MMRTQECNQSPGWNGEFDQAEARQSAECSRCLPKEEAKAEKQAMDAKNEQAENNEPVEEN